MEKKIFRQGGTHLILDLFGCNPEKINSGKFLHCLMKKICQQAPFTVLKKSSYKFNPHGITILYLLSESHFSIHTWPESGFVSVDIFSCGEHDRDTFKKLAKIISKELEAKNYKVRILKRGL